LRGIVFKVAVIVGLFGLIMSRPFLLEWLTGFSNAEALLIWYAAFAVFLLAIGYAVMPEGMNLRWLVALVLVTWALGIVLYLPISDYSTEYTGATVTSVEGATEDMVTYEFLASLGYTDSTGIVTYAVIPFLLIMFAGYVVAPQMFAKVFGLVMGRAGA
jgi:hypothetical protein